MIAFTSIDIDLTTLLRNIVVAAGLTRSFRLGDAFAWRPNIDGRPAP